MNINKILIAVMFVTTVGYIMWINYQLTMEFAIGK